MDKTEPFLYKIWIEGEDDIERWTAEGSYLQT
jgi:hypothetical protein